ncbi:MAG: hypothetical protein AAFQ98_08145 [Bacteroidota bacterium]
MEAEVLPDESGVGPVDIIISLSVVVLGGVGVYIYKVWVNPGWIIRGYKRRFLHDRMYLPSQDDDVLSAAAENAVLGVQCLSLVFIGTLLLAIGIFFLYGFEEKFLMKAPGLIQSGSKKIKAFTGWMIFQDQVLSKALIGYWAVVMIIGIIQFPELFEIPGVVLFVFVVLIAFRMIFYFLIRHKQGVIQELQQMLFANHASSDSRPPVLLLRSFVNDELYTIYKKPNQYLGVSGQMRALSRYPDYAQSKIAEAGMVVEILDLGFLVLLGHYDEVDTSAAIDHIYLQSKEECWWEVFKESASYAQFILIIPEISDGLVEEVSYLMSSQLLDKTLIYLPNLEDDEYFKLLSGEQERILSRWDEIRAFWKESGFNFPDYDTRGMVYQPHLDLSPRVEKALGDDPISAFEDLLHEISLPVPKGGMKSLISEVRNKLHNHEWFQDSGAATSSIKSSRCSGLG